MQELVHHSTQTLEFHLDKLNKVQELYLSKSFDFDAHFESFLHDLLDYFKAKGNTTYESEVLKIMSTVSTVKRGFNPVKMEKVNVGKRDLVSGFSFNGIENIHGFLIDLLSKEQRKLEESEELLSGLIISMYQNGILDEDKIKDLHTISKIETFWNKLLPQNTTIAGINKKLRLTLIAEDIYLILEKIFAKIS